MNNQIKPEPERPDQDPDLYEPAWYNSTFGILLGMATILLALGVGIALITWAAK